MSIQEFYRNNVVDFDFDAEFYAATYPDTARFYQPYCLNNKISNRERLFYHYFLYGRTGGYAKHAEGFKPNVDKQKFTDLQVKGYTVSELLDIL